MTSTTFSLNGGIYKNTLRRFKWGSFIYFAMLFFSVPFVFMINRPDITSSAYTVNPYTLLESTYIIVPMLTAYAVPTVVALLIFNYVHSPKQGIFTHSIPVTRAQNYISGIFAAFTLMFVPVIANALILFAMLPFGYGRVLCAKAILTWTFINVFILFFMFSVAAFASFLTGNSFAQVGINVIIHVLPLVVSLAIGLICDMFVYGYIASETSIAQRLVDGTPAVWMANHFGNGFNGAKIAKLFAMPSLWIYLASAVVIYALSYILYKHRKIENCGDVAAFAIFKPILKYTVTAFAAIAAFGILTTNYVAPVTVALVIAVICAIVYFGSEMLLSKTLKVFSAYKGYIGFSVCFAAMLAFFAFGGAFGYERYVPQINEIKESTLCSNYYGSRNLPMVSGEAAAKTVTGFHKGILKNIPTAAKYSFKDKGYSTLTVQYKLNNGKKVMRQYDISDKDMTNALNQMFAYSEYKMKYSLLSTLNIDNIDKMNLSTGAGNYRYEYALNEDAKPFLRAVIKDMENLSFDQFNEGEGIDLHVNLDASPKENKKSKIFVDDGRKHYYNFSLMLNRNYVNTINFLKEKGYYDLIRNNISERFCIAKDTFTRDVTSYTYHGEKNTYLDFQVAPDSTVKISAEDGKQIFDLIMSQKYSDLSMGENYLILCEPSQTLYSSNYALCFPAGEMPEFIKKYLN